mmetsp:Transcript_18265/g.25739  ORF Transcript_18265/g.25739 Transcript_18265/m.25739 type:complete len:506 (-) Transcript_18265:80-1597(-)
MTSNPEVDSSCHKVSDHLAVTVVGRRPRAIVVILGWIGCEMRQIQSYLDLYHDEACSTIVAGAPAHAIATNDIEVLGEVSIAAMRETARLIRMAEMSEMGFGAVPILIHAFGNGGCVVLEEMEKRIREVVSEESLEKMRNNSPIRPPLSFPGMTSSMKSIPSLSSTFETFSDDEDDGVTFPHYDQLALLPRMPTVPPRRPSTRKLLSFDECRASTKKSPKSAVRVPVLKQPKVHRVDKERIYLYPPTTHDPRHNPEERAYRLDVALVTSRLHLGGIIFDSAPCYPTLKSDLKAAEKGMNNFMDRILMQFIIQKNRWTCGDCGRRTLTISGDQANSRTDQFWKNMQHLSLTKRHVYIYDTNDTVCDYVKLEQLIDAQRENGMDIRARKLTGSDSLSDQTVRLGAFSGLLEDLLNSVSARWLEEEDSEEGFSSSDEESDNEASNSFDNNSHLVEEGLEKERLHTDEDVPVDDRGLLGILDDDEDADDFYLTPEDDSFHSASDSSSLF